MAPLHLLRAVWQGMGVVGRVHPDVVLGFGGYITMPGGIASVLRGVPLILHEQNSVAGLANRLLARFATRVLTAFPGVLPRAQWIGNPLRPEFFRHAMPSTRFAGRSGPLRLLVVGGSLGAQALNTLVPQALALMEPTLRPVVTHQSGEKNIQALDQTYARLGVHATLTPFIEDTAQAFADADLVLCRAGASTVTEIAAIGAAALFVPFPGAVDDHQTHNARFLADRGAAWLVAQPELSPQGLAQRLTTLDRSTLLALAQAAKETQARHGSHPSDATQEVVAACQELVA